MLWLAEQIASTWVMLMQWFIVCVGVVLCVSFLINAAGYLYSKLKRN